MRLKLAMMIITGALLALPVFAQEAQQAERLLGGDTVSLEPIPGGTIVHVTSQEKSENSKVSILSDLISIRTLHEGSLNAGEHTFIWDGKDDAGTQLPEGSYAVKVESEQLLYQEGFSTLTEPEPELESEPLHKTKKLKSF